MIKDFLSDLLAIKEEEFVLLRLKNHLYEQKKFNVIKDIPKPEYKKYITPRFLIFVYIVLALASPFYGLLFVKSLGNSVALFISSFTTLLLIVLAVFVPKAVIENKRKNQFASQMSDYNSYYEKTHFKQTVISQRIGSVIESIDAELKQLHEFEGKICIRNFTSLKNRTYAGVAVSIDLVGDDELRFNELIKRIQHERNVNPSIFQIEKVYQNLDKVDSKKFPVFYESVIKTLEEIEYLKNEVDKILILNPSGKIEGAGFRKYLKKQREKNKKIFRTYVRN